MAAIDGAQYEIYFETYIFADDATGAPCWPRWLPLRAAACRCA
jgi:hypothetical protein